MPSHSGTPNFGGGGFTTCRRFIYYNKANPGKLDVAKVIEIQKGKNYQVHALWEEETEERDIKTALGTKRNIEAAGLGGSSVDACSCMLL